jgi:hypothetical protein
MLITNITFVVVLALPTFSQPIFNHCKFTKIAGLIAASDAVVENPREAFLVFFDNAVASRYITVTLSVQFSSN